MAEEVRLWKVHKGDALIEVRRASLSLEQRIENWLANDISILDPNLIVIGRQVETDFGGIIDLLCLNCDGETVIVELKRDRTPREITAQVLDYAAWVKDLSNEAITSRANAFLYPNSLDQAFQTRFNRKLPDVLNEDHRLLVVGSQIDPGSERIINYLSQTHGVNINAATFQFFCDESGAEYLARFFLIEPAQVELQAQSKGGSKRRPNLTSAEAEGIAEAAGVAQLYGSAVSQLEKLFTKRTTRSSIGFFTNVRDSHPTVISILPKDSNAKDGLFFQLYSLRLQELLNLNESQVRDLLPPNTKPWSYAGSEDDPWWRGFEGFFASEDDISRLVAGLNTALAGRF